MKKFISVILAVLVLVTAIPYAYAADDPVVAAVVEMLEGIDTLQQMQDKRSTYKGGSKHYDIGTTNASIISAHEKAREGYESYVEDMFAKRAQAQQAYDALSDEQKTQIDPSLTAKLSNVLPTVFEEGDYPVTPRYDAYSFEAVKVGVGFGYEVSNHMVSGSIPQTFILVDTSDGATSWSPDGKYVYGESNYEVAYCCDKETGLEYTTHYKRTNPENSSYFDEAEAQHIRAVLESSYPFLTISEMKDRLKIGGLDSDFVDSLTRADIISAVQMAVWSYANINDAAADGLEYFASIDITKNIDLYFHPLHNYTNETWDWLPGKRQRTFDARAQYRVNTLAEYLCNLEPVAVRDDEIVISDVSVLKTKLAEHGNGTYDLTLLITVNGTILENDDVIITVSSCNDSDSGDVSITYENTIKAIPGQSVYKTVINTKDGDTVKVQVDGIQELPRGVYFYEPEGGRDVSQTLVGVSEGNTNIYAEADFIFTPEIEITPVTVPVTDIVLSSSSIELETGKTERIAVTVSPEDATEKGVVFLSSDESVVKIDEEGNLEAVGEGKATITVKSKDNEEIKKTFTVTVKNPPPEYTYDVPESFRIMVGETKKPLIKIYPEDAELLGIFYRSEDKSIAAVDDNGNITGLRPGQTIITVFFSNGDVREIPVTVIAAPIINNPKHHVCFGKTDGIGWYEVSINGGDFFPQGPNSTLEVAEGSVLVVRVQDMWIDDEFDFYVNGKKVKLDAANTVTFIVDGYMLIGALSMDTEVPDVEESLNLFQRLIRAIKSFFDWIAGFFKK